MNAYLNIIEWRHGLRMERVCNNAFRLAQALRSWKKNLTQLSGCWSPVHTANWQCQLSGKGGVILTIRAGSKERAYNDHQSSKDVKIATNIGDVENPGDSSGVYNLYPQYAEAMEEAEV